VEQFPVVDWRTSNRVNIYHEVVREYHKVENRWTIE